MNFKSLLLPVPGDSIVNLQAKETRMTGLALGQYGFTVLTAGQTANNVAVIHATEDSVVSAAPTPDFVGTLTGVSLKAGDKVYGRFLTVTLTSGKAIAYHLVAVN